MLSPLIFYLAAQNFRDKSTETLLTGAKLKHYCNKAARCRDSFYKERSFFACPVRTFIRLRFAAKARGKSSLLEEARRRSARERAAGREETVPVLRNRPPTNRRIFIIPRFSFVLSTKRMRLSTFWRMRFAICPTTTTRR